MQNQDAQPGRPSVENLGGASLLAASRHRDRAGSTAGAAAGIVVRRFAGVRMFAVVEQAAAVGTVVVVVVVVAVEESIGLFDRGVDSLPRRRPRTSTGWPYLLCWGAGTQPNRIEIESRSASLNQARLRDGTQRVFGRLGAIANPRTGPYSVYHEG